MEGKVMGKYWLVCIALFLNVHLLYAQDDFEKYVREQELAFKKYVAKEDSAYKAYNDSINKAFGRYLAETWPDCPLVKLEPPIVNPVPLTKVTPDKERMTPFRQPVKDEREKPLKKRPSVIPNWDREHYSLPQIPRVSMGLKMNFFGAECALMKLSCTLPRLVNVDEKAVSNYWNALSECPHVEWRSQIIKLREDLQLNDWGTFLLINEMYSTYVPDGSENEQVVFTVFTLNQFGYAAKIGRVGEDLIPMVAFDCDVYNTTFFTIPSEGSKRFSVINMKHRDLTSVKCQHMSYPNAEKCFNVWFESSPRLGESIVEKNLNDGVRDYRVRYNENHVNFYSTLPCLDFAIYARATMEDVLWGSLQGELEPLVQSLSEEDAVNLLLRFVQFAFEYKEDGKQFDYEKWNFAEETVGASFSDCEDRSILFAQLVRGLLNIPVVLVHYPGRHLATAVHFRDSSVSGDYILVDNEKYLLCDPTYMGAKLGMGMPQLKNVSVKIVKF